MIWIGLDVQIVLKMREDGINLQIFDNWRRDWEEKKT